MGSDGSNPVQLTHDPGRDSEPSWSDSGQLIAFTSNRDGQDEIYLINSNGTGLRRLTNHPLPDFQPAWRPAASGGS
jgi:TolB protein